MISAEQVNLSMTKEKPVKYVAKIYKMGEDKMVVSIPKKVWPKLEKLQNKDLLVTLEEIIED